MAARLLRPPSCLSNLQDITAGTVLTGMSTADTVLINGASRAAGDRKASLEPGAAPASEAGPLAGNPELGAGAGSAAPTGPLPAAGSQPQQQQHAAGLTDQLNRTSYTLLSNSTGTTAGSDDSTVPIRTPVPAGAASSGSGSGSEDATVNLRRGGGSSDETLVLNRSRLGGSSSSSGAGAGDSAGKEGAAAASAGREGAALLKPRRIGMLGRALRVAPGSKTPAPEGAAPQPAGSVAAPAAAVAPACLGAAGPAAQQAGEEDEAGRKRKAEGEAAQSPKAVGEAKRRQSPIDHHQEASGGGPAACGWVCCGGAGQPATDRQLSGVGAGLLTCLP